MKNECLQKKETEVTEESVEYYMSNINNPHIMKDLHFVDPLLYAKLMRWKFVNSIRNKQAISTCPECNGEIIFDSDKCIEYCDKCGLITRTCTYYTAGVQYELPYGLRL